MTVIDMARVENEQWKTDRVGKFKSKYDEGGADACWIWNGCISQDGYGLHVLYRRLSTSHRIAWVLANGPIPVGMSVCHHCDVRRCVNPAHLFLATHADNMRDCIAKGRHTSAKLTESIVRELRSLRSAGAGFAELGRLFGVHEATAARACNGKHWKGA